MRLASSFFYTIREDLKDEESISGNLLTRAGMIKKTSAGVYMYLPLGLKALNKIEKIVREEMNATGALEVLMPSLIPEEVYIESGRRENFGKSMFSLYDRNHKPYVLGPTHEELFAVAAKMAIKSYKDLPIMIYQFQNKFRDEPRPRFGLIRVREFHMKDSYTFDRDLAGLDHSYQLMFDAYKRAFDRMGLDYRIVRADTGVMGGLLSEEFQAICPIGEDVLVVEDSSGYAANIEVAACPEPKAAPEVELAELEAVETPEQKTIEEVSAFLQKTPQEFMKSLVYLIDGREYLICLRGDHNVCEQKVLKLLGANEAELADAQTVERVTGAPVGFAGPVGATIPIIMDREVEQMRNFCVGANQLDLHYINCNLRDFKAAKVGDIREITEGEICENGAGPVHFVRGIEIGNTFKLGTKYSEAMDLYFQDEQNSLHPVYMGSYGIGPGRCLAAIVEQNNADGKIFWPKEIAPIQVGIVIINMKNKEQVELGEKLYQDFSQSDLDVALDDRNERAGVKFNDHELIGTWCRITCGKKSAEGIVEVKFSDSEESFELPLAEVKDFVLQRYNEA
ncbi:MAG: proline--tRNA ligase [Eubacteriales bacterium]|nr:proline--tRNA ligase [Eubacteriales bacterium]